MPENKYGFRPVVQGKLTEPVVFGPAQLRTFAEQIKHVACSNLAFVAELLRLVSWVEPRRSAPPFSQRARNRWCVGVPGRSALRSEGHPARFCIGAVNFEGSNPASAAACRRAIPHMRSSAFRKLQRAAPRAFAGERLVCQLPSTVRGTPELIYPKGKTCKPSL